MNLHEWNAELQRRFPKRLVGELEFGEDEFRRLLADMREFGNDHYDHLRRPVERLPFVTMTAMTFTARYDYDGSFWNAFRENLGRTEEVDHAAWGHAFRSGLKKYGLFQPPSHWMVNVFPVLYQSILPERFRDSFGELVRDLRDLDVRELSDDDLVEALMASDFQQHTSLAAFIFGDESREIALELIRSVSEDYRVGLPPDTNTLRGRIVDAALRSDQDVRPQFRPRIQPLSWRWDFNSGRLGVLLTSSKSYESRPLHLRIADRVLDVSADHADNAWYVRPQLLPLPTRYSGCDGRLEAFDDELLDVRVAHAPASGPYLFRAFGDYGVFEVGGFGTPGNYVIVDDGRTIVRDTTGMEAEPVEEIIPPVLPGADRARMFELRPGDSVQRDGVTRFTVRRGARPDVESRARSQWQAELGRDGTIPVFADPPRLRFSTPVAGAHYVFINEDTQEVFVDEAFEEEADVRSDVPEGRAIRATVRIDGRTAGSGSVSFVVLPLRTESEVSQTKISLYGRGELFVGARRFQLHEDEPTSVIYPDLLAESTLPYIIDGRTYRLHYAGPRPTLWGINRVTLGDERLVISLDTAIASRALIITGIPGTPVSLMDDRGAQLTAGRIDADGNSALSLEEPIRRARAVDSLELRLVAGDAVFDALAIMGAPQVRFEDIALTDGHLQGRVALDAFVDGLVLELHVARSPWQPPVEIPLERFGPSWSLDAEVPPNWYVLRLRATTADGIKTIVMTNDGPFERECGSRYDHRSDLDVWLFNTLNSSNDVNAGVVAHQDVAEAICRCLTLAGTQMGVENSFRIETILQSLAPKVHLSDIPRIESATLSCKPAIQMMAARAGIPVAMFESILNDQSRRTIAPGQKEIFGRLCRPEMQRNDPNVEAFCAAIESLAVPIALAFVDLFRRTKTRVLDTPILIEDALGSPTVLQLTASVADDIPEMWLGPIPSSMPLFGRTVVTLWKLAYLVFRSQVQPTESVIQPAAIVASRLLGNEFFHDLLASALAQVSELLSAKQELR